MKTLIRPRAVQCLRAYMIHVSNGTARRVSTSTIPEERTLSLPDGRILGYAEYGIPTGSPLFFFHGYPSSRLEAYGFDRVARRRGIRVIAPDRPGFGVSSFQSFRRIIDWPADVRALAHHLKLSSFSVLGGSGGGPYALACAHMLPYDMLSSVGVLAGAPPWEAGTQDLPRSSRALAFAVTHGPSGLRIATDMLMGMLRWTANSGPATRWIDKWLTDMKRRQKHEQSDKREDENEDLSIEERRERLLRTVFEGFRQGARGAVQEAQLLAQDWGFRLQDVNYDKIQLWHGTQDTRAPVRMIRYMAERLPHGELREYEDAGHFDIADHLEDVLSELLPNNNDTSMKAANS